MLTTSNETGNRTAFTARQLMNLTGIRSLSTARRGLEGLLVKLSIEREEKGNGNGSVNRQRTIVFTRRKKSSPADVKWTNVERVAMGKAQPDAAIVRLNARSPVLLRIRCLVDERHKWLFVVSRD
jgi:hypothetical protein